METTCCLKAGCRTLAMSVGLLTAGLVFAACTTAPPLDTGSAQNEIEKAFAAATTKGTASETASMLVHSGKMGLHIELQANPDGPEAFHIASAGKLFTTVLIGRLIDSGKLTPDTPVAQLLEKSTLDGLFAYRGTDYQSTVTVRHLLTHTSGVADYFSGPVKGGKGEPSVDKLIASEPARRWTPMELLAFSRDRQEPVGAPGEKFHYSDTGFILLGLIIESLYGQAFHDVLADEILAPLGMDDTFMPFVSAPASGAEESIRKAWLDKAEVSTYASITADWSGGGIASTEKDLLKFSEALWAGQLVSMETLEELRLYDQVFINGIEYGAGLMRMDFQKFFFLLKSYPKPEGHIGILATLMLYDPERDIHIIMNFGDTASMETAFRLLIQVFGIMMRLP